MIYQAKKLLCYTTSIALLTSSLTPVYAAPNHHNSGQEDLADGEHHRPRLLVPEDSSQEMTKTLANGQTWTPEFVKNLASHTYNKMSSWFEPTENASSHDLNSLAEYFAEDFTEEIEDIKTSQPNRKRLEDLQDIVWKGELSPYEYDKGLRELKSHVSKTLLNEVQDQFQTKLKSFPAFLNGNFQRDLITYLEDTRIGDTRVVDNHHTQQPLEDFEELLNYYRGIQNPLDYTNTLVGLRRFIQKNQKSLSLTDSQYGDLNRAIVKAVKQRGAKEYSALKAKSRFVQSALQELPYTGEDLPEGFNSSLSSIAKKDVIKGDYLSESLSLMTAFKGLAQGAYNGMKYAIEHPGQAITIGLASQVAASAALSTSRNLKRAIGDEFQINQNTTSAQIAPSVASLTNGNVFVAWMGDQTGNNDIYGRLFSANGVALSNEFLINQNTAGDQLSPSVAGLTNGNAFATWQGDQTVNPGIYGRVFYPNGTPLTNEFGINQVTSLNQGNAFVASLTNGNAFVAWVGNQAGNYDIYGRLFFPNGTPLSDEFGINQITASSQNGPSVTSLTNGNAFVAWIGDQFGGLGDIYGRVFSANGTALSNEFGINQVTTSYQDSPSVASLTGGNVFVAWQGDQTGNNDIYGRLFSANGTALSNEFTINQVTTSDQLGNSVASLTNGNAFVAWTGYQPGDSDVYARLFSANGTALSNEFTVNQVTASSQYGPSVASLTNGNAFVAWGGYQTGDSDIYGRVLSANGTVIGATGTTGTTGSTGTTGTTGSTGTTGTTAISTTGTPTTSAVTTGIATSSSAVTTATTNPTTSSTIQGSTSSSTTGGDVSSSHKLTPSWILSPAKVISSGFERLWNMAKGIK